MAVQSLNNDSIDFGWFLTYKFFNSLFLGLSIGAVFTLYEPLSPAIFSAGGIGLALATLVVATQYHRIFIPYWFFRLSVSVEITILLGILVVLIYPFGEPVALFVYLGYQFTFALGNYLVRCETLLFVDNRRLGQLDMAKQVAYLVGMGSSWLGYQIFATQFNMVDKVKQVTMLHWPLLVIEVIIIFCLTCAFRSSRKRDRRPA